MIRKSEIEKLIIKGFDLELIAFELDVSIDYVVECKKNIEAKYNITKRYIEKKVETNNDAHIRMEKMREKYMELASIEEKTDEEQQKHVPEVNTNLKEEAINATIETIEEIIKSMQNLEKIERRKKTIEVLKLLNGIKEATLTIKHAEKLQMLLEAKELKMIKIDETDRTEYYIDMHRTKIAIKLAKAVEEAYMQTENIEELKALAQKITYAMIQRNPVAIGTIKSKIERKINAIKHNKIIDGIRNDISDKIESIIIALAQGTLEIEQANSIIKEEAKERVKNRPKTIFALTEEQERKQILIQIKTALREKIEKYHIENPSLTIQLITRSYQWRTRASNNDSCNKSNK